MKKVYNATVRSTVYDEVATRSFSVVAPGINVAMVRAKGLMYDHEELVGLHCITELA